MNSLLSTAPAVAAGLREVRQRAARVALGTACVYALPVLLGWLLLEMPIDFLANLPRWGRACFFLGAWAGVGAVVYWWGVRPILRPQPDDRVALTIERALPQFRSRYIASVQLAQAKAGDTSPALVAALLKETTDMVRETDLREVITTDHLRRWRDWLIIAGIVAVVVLALTGKYSLPLLARAFLSDRPIPRNTEILSWTGDRIIAAGDDLRLELQAAGKIPATGTIEMRTASGVKQHFTLDPDPLKASHFIRTLAAVQESFSYSLHVGDNWTKTAQVQVRPRPVVLSVSYVQQWPAYTKRPPQPRPPTDLRLLTGSKLVARIKPSVPLSHASLLLLGQDRKTVVQSVPLQVDGTEWTGTARLTAKEIAGLTFQLADSVGVESVAMAVTPVTILPDQPPTISVTWPLRREELVTNRATLLVAFDAKDDFGLGGIRLHYAVNWSEGAKFRTLDLDLGGESTRTLNRRFEWKLDRIQPPLQEGDVVDYWFEARDNNTETGPGVTFIPDHYQARVVSDDEKRADLAARLNDTLNGLKDVRQGQEELSKRLGDLINELPKGP